MGSVLSAIFDDENEWFSLMKKADIQDRDWKLYSEEWEFAMEGYKRSGYKGRKLKLYVKQQLEKRNLDRAHKKEFQELEKLSYLEDKYK
jgi:hypothetical protein